MYKKNIPKNTDIDHIMVASVQINYYGFDNPQVLVFN